MKSKLKLYSIAVGAKKHPRQLFFEDWGEVLAKASNPRNAAFIARDSMEGDTSVPNYKGPVEWQMTVWKLTEPDDGGPGLIYQALQTVPTYILKGKKSAKN